jgi:hypothetical protein
MILLDIFGSEDGGSNFHRNHNKYKKMYMASYLKWLEYVYPLLSDTKNLTFFFLILEITLLCCSPQTKVYELMLLHDNRTARDVCSASILQVASEAKSHTETCLRPSVRNQILNNLLCYMLYWRWHISPTCLDRCCYFLWGHFITLNM